MGVRRVISSNSVKAGIFSFFCLFFPNIVLDLSENQGASQSRLGSILPPRERFRTHTIPFRVDARASCKLQVGKIAATTQQSFAAMQDAEPASVLCQWLQVVGYHISKSIFTQFILRLVVRLPSF